MVTNFLATKTGSNKFEATKRSLVVNIALVNITDKPQNVNLYLVPSGKSIPVYDSDGNLVSGNLETIYLPKTTIPPHNAIYLESEKILLEEGDAIVAVSEEDNAVAIHISWAE